MKLIPIDTTLIVEIEKVEQKSKGGIQLPGEYIDKEQMSITEGVVVALGDFAFYEINEGKTPKMGDKVYFKRHSGIMHSDKETGKEYRIIHDQDVYAMESMVEEVR